MTQDLGKHMLFCNTAGGQARYQSDIDPTPPAPLPPAHEPRAAARSSPCSKGRQRGREQSHTTERTMSASTGRGKFYFPTNRKHETPHSLSNILVLYISLCMAKKRKAVLWVKNNDSPSLHGKGRLHMLASGHEPCCWNSAVQTLAGGAGDGKKLRCRN